MWLWFKRYRTLVSFILSPQGLKSTIYMAGLRLFGLISPFITAVQRCVILLFLSSPKPVMAAPVQPNPDALAALVAPPAAPPVIPPAPA